MLPTKNSNFPTPGVESSAIVDLWTKLSAHQQALLNDDQNGLFFDYYGNIKKSSANACGLAGGCVQQMASCGSRECAKPRTDWPSQAPMRVSHFCGFPTLPMNPIQELRRRIEQMPGTIAHGKL